jgi:hypothetical protein
MSQARFPVTNAAPVEQEIAIRSGTLGVLTVRFSQR